MCKLYNYSGKITLYETKPSAANIIIFQVHHKTAWHQKNTRLTFCTLSI